MKQGTLISWRVSILRRRSKTKSCSRTSKKWNFETGVFFLIYSTLRAIQIRREKRNLTSSAEKKSSNAKEDLKDLFYNSSRSAIWYHFFNISVLVHLSSTQITWNSTAGWKYELIVRRMIADLYLWIHIWNQRVWFSRSITH